MQGLGRDARARQGLVGGDRGAGGSGVGVIVASLLVLLVMAIIMGLEMRSGLPPALDITIALLAGLVVGLLGSALALGVHALIRRLPLRTTVAFLGVAAGLAVVLALSSGFSLVTILVGVVLFSPLLGASAIVGGAIGYGLKHGFRRPMAIVWALGSLILFAAALFWMITPGQEAVVSNWGIATAPGLGVAPSVDNPGAPGPYKVSFFTYGSGDDIRRLEYGSAVDVVTRSVDGSAFLAGWDGLGGRLRSWYWGFGPEQLPLNARVWYPQGEGPFPLVLVVHGNHRMFEYSDPGYAYIGEHLASRGFIVASVDENFINGSLYGNLEGENSARGWLLLQHLALWREWNQAPSHVLAGRIDMDNIALIGHSRGGEAIVLANAYNNLTHYPGDAQQRFDFGFNIRSLVAIAPVDGQYAPADRPAPVDDVNYLLITGLHDADVADISGGRVYERIQIPRDSDLIKAAVHIYGANHGQFNTVWGNKDLPPPLHWFLNKRPLISADLQRQTTLAFVSAFLEATLHKADAYIPVLRDSRVASAWLPDVPYVAQFQDGSQRIIASFDEDLDITTTTLAGGTISGTGLVSWYEGALPTPYNRRTGFGAQVSWDLQADPDPATLTFALPALAERGWVMDHTTSLVLSIMDGRQPSDRTVPLDFSVRLAVDDGSEVSLPLSHFGTFWLPPEVKRFKLGLLENVLLNEPNLVRRFELPVAAFAAQLGMPIDDVRAISLVFDITPTGTIYLDAVSIADHM